jgi:hypothetical protein
VYSYGDTIAISFTSDRKMIPDPSFYADCLQSSFDELLAAAKAKPMEPVKAPRAAKPAVAKPRTRKIVKAKS